MSGLEIVGGVASIAALIQLTAKVAIQSCEYIRAVNGAESEIGRLVNELNELGKVLEILRNHINTNPKTIALRELEGSLQGCTSELKKLQSKLSVRNRIGFRKFIGRLKWPFQVQESMQFISEIERFKSLFNLALAADHLVLSEDTNTVVHDIWLSQQTKSTTQDLKHRTKVLRWLYLDPVDKRHLEINQMRQKDTGMWLPNTPEFQEWSTGKSKFLWGHGIPGAGKTYLSSVVIDHFLVQTRATNTTGIAYFYFDYVEQSQQTSSHIIACLAKQLVGQLPNIPTKIDELYTRLIREDKRPTLEELYTTFLIALNAFSNVFLIFDALDECEKERKAFLPLLRRMASDGANIFVTSRPHPQDIKDFFHDAKKIELSPKEQDITAYIRDKIDESPRARNLLQKPELRDRIVPELVESSNGMFLLVHFHIQFICQQTSQKQIRIALDKLKSPSSEANPLEAIYNRAVETIRNHQSRADAELALRVLIWLVEARRTLTIDELQEALSVEPGQSDFEEESLPDKATLLDVCAGLVTLDEQNNTIRLVHYTTKEYLVKESIIPKSAGFEVAMTCTTFLTFNTFAQFDSCELKDTLRSRVKLHPFLRYAVVQLSPHLKLCNEDLTVDIVLKLLKNRDSLFSYLNTYRYLYHFTRFVDRTRCVPLNTASGLGHITAINRLLDEDGDLSGWGHCGRTALLEASYEGQETAVRLLLEKGADLAFQDKEQWTALHLAASRGHEGVVRLLLEKGADLTVCGKDGWTALHIAALEGHEGVVRLLLEKGADLTVCEEDGWTALHLAALNGHEGVIRLLLEKGADLTVCGKDGRTALHIAASRGHEGVIRLLLEKGADLTVCGEDGWTALHLAASRGHEGVIRLLLEKGADPAVRNETGETTLDLAALNGDTKLIKLLHLKNFDNLTEDTEG